MKQHLDHDLWFGQRDGADKTVRVPLEWPLLAARLSAAHAYQRSFAQSEPIWAGPQGSFDPVAAQQIIDYAVSAPTDWGFDPAMKPLPYPDVNPIVLGVRKSMSGKEYPITSHSIPAIEG